MAISSGTIVGIYAVGVALVTGGFVALAVEVEEKRWRPCIMVGGVSSVIAGVGSWMVALGAMAGLR